MKQKESLEDQLVLGSQTTTLNQLFEHFIDNLDEEEHYIIESLDVEIDLTIGYFSNSQTTKEQFFECKKMFFKLLIQKLLIIR
jgi:hypothetical protein